MTKEPTAASQDKFVLRLPDGLRDRIAASAKQNGRSMNAEIIQVLTQYFPPEPDLDELVDNIDMFISWANSDTGYARAWKENLSASLTDLVDRLKRGEASKALGPRPFSPKELQQQASGKLAVEKVKMDQRARQDILERTGPSDIDAILADGYLNHLSRNRLISARRVLEEGSISALPDAFTLLALDFDLIEDPEGAARKVLDALTKAASKSPASDN